MYDREVSGADWAREVHSHCNAARRWSTLVEIRRVRIVALHNGDADLFFLVAGNGEGGCVACYS